MDKTNKLLPQVEDMRKHSTAACASIFEELDEALTFAEPFRDKLNPLQQELLDRFIATAKVFARDMLAADGSRDALREVFGLSDAVTAEAVPQAATRKVGDFEIPVPKRFTHNPKADPELLR